MRLVVEGLVRAIAGRLAHQVKDRKQECRMALSAETKSSAVAAVKEAIGRDIVDTDFNVSGQDFQILATIRYDPNLTHVMADESSEEVSMLRVDPRLTSMVKGESFLAGSEEAEFLDYLDASSPLSEALHGQTVLDTLYAGDASYTHSDTVFEGICSEKPLSGDELWTIYYSRFFLLGEHYKRLKLALAFFQWKLALTPRLFLTQLVYSLPVQGSMSIEDKMRALMQVNVCYKMRVLLSKDGSMKIEAHELPQFPSSFPNPQEYIINNLLGGFLNLPPTWDVYINPEPIMASPFTTFKTTNRGHYSRARENMELLKQRTKDQRKYSEILVYNDLYQLMEGSITNVARKSVSQEAPDQARYVTPCLSSGCLCGVTRYFLLRKGLLQENHVDVRDLSVGDEILLFNGIMGCVKGVIRNSVDFSNT